MKGLKHYLGSSVALLLGALASQSYAANPVAKATLVRPTPNQEFHIGGAADTQVTVEGSGMEVQIKDADPNEHFDGVTYEMWVKIDGGTRLAQDYSNGTNVVCDASGFWNRLANGTGSLIGSKTCIKGDHYAEAYSKITMPGGGSANQPRRNDFKVLS